MNNVFDFSIVTNWIHQMLTSLMPEGLAIFLECVVIGVCIILMYAVLAIILIYMERKICAFFQCRLGPMRVGKWGLLQVPCDVIKMLTKEIIDLKFSDRFLYNLAPFMVIIASFLTFACLPINKGLEVLDFNVGVFFLLAASSIGVVGILLAGWSSNNKFSLIGAMRSGAQIISYELSCGLSILTMVVLMGTMQFSEIVEGQADGWFIFKGHIPAMIVEHCFVSSNSDCEQFLSSDAKLRAIAQADARGIAAYYGLEKKDPGEVDVEPLFRDCRSHWAKDYVNRAADAGWVNGEIGRAHV